MPAKIYHYDLHGKRETKYDFLKNNSVSTVNWTELKPDDKYHFFVPKNFDQQVEWEKGIKISELFEVFNSGVETAKDSFIIKFQEKDVYNLKYLIENNEVNEISNKTGFDNKEKIQQCKTDLEKNKVTIKSILYRPFDKRFTMYSNLSQGVLWRPRHDTSKHLLQKNLGLICASQNRQASLGYFYITSLIVDRHILDTAGDSTSSFPLYLYPDNGGDLMQEQKPRPNFNPEIIKQIEEKLEMKLDWEAQIGKTNVEKGELEFTPTDLLDYIYAVLHSPSYREKYKEFLKIDFPRVSFEIKKDRFWKLVKLGKKLRKLHLMEGINPLELEQAEISGEGKNVVEKINYKNNQVWINDTKYFDDVPESVWNFYIGGYQPAQKWLKDRKGRELIFDDILHYRKIVWVLGETERLMGEVDNE